MKRNEIFEGIENLKRDLNDYKVIATNSSYNERINSFLPRFHRLVLDGSYDGEMYYKAMKINLNKKFTVKGLEMIIIRTLNQLISHEYFNNEYRLGNPRLKEILVESLGIPMYERLMNDLLDNIKDFQNDVLGLDVHYDFIKFPCSLVIVK
jgi:hypothetical protein